MKSMVTIDLRSVRHVACIAAMMFAAHPVVAALVPVTDSYSYDGSYEPDSVTPPVGQSTWAVAETGGLAIAINSPSAGLATLDDSVGNGRIAIQRDSYGDATFNSTPAGIGWSYTIRMAIDSFGGLDG